MPRPSRDPSAAPPAVYAGILLCSVGVLMQEILLTRIFSFTIWYHLAYLTISTALLGFGAAGTLLALRPALVERDPRRVAAWGSAGAGVALLVALAVLAPRPISPDALLDEPGRFALGLLGYYALVCVPFTLAGVAVAIPLAAWSREANRLYAGDLLGAGLGCAAAVAALAWLDGPRAVFANAAIFLLAGAVYATAGPLRLAFAGAAVAVLAASPLAEQALPFRPAESKSLGKAVHEEGARVFYTEWSPVNRVDLYAEPNRRGGFWTAFGRSREYRSVPPRAMTIVYDGHNGSDVYQVRGRDSLDVFDHHILSTPYKMLERPRVLVIGVGGGIDVLNALYHGAEQVTGVDLQPITIELHRGRLARFTGGWMQRPEVELVAAEGRHFVRSHDDVYDIVQITAVDTFAAQNTGAYVLAESYLYTVEAFDDFLDRLSDDGMLSIIVGDHLYSDPDVVPPYSTRLALVAREVLRRRGVSSPERHVALTAWGIPDYRARGKFVAGAWIQNLLVKKSPFTEEEIDALRAWSEPRDFRLRLAPDGRPDDDTIARVFRAPPEERSAMLASQGFHLGPITDDRPFFFHVLPWTQLFLDRRVEWQNPGSATGQIVLLLMLAQAVVLGTLLVAAPLRARGGGGMHRRETAGFLLFFLSLGLGFLLIEISFVQKYVLVLGYPTYSLSVTIFSLLVFAAAGAALSRRGWGRPRPFLAGLLAVTIALVALEVAALPWIREAALTLSLPARIAATAALQLPLGVVLGMYFPTGLELLRRREPRLVPWAWAVNGVASVAAAVLAVVLGMSLGFSGVALLAAGIYAGGTGALLLTLRTGDPRDAPPRGPQEAER